MAELRLFGQVSQRSFFFMSARRASPAVRRAYATRCLSRGDPGCGFCHCPPKTPVVAAARTSAARSHKAAAILRKTSRRNSRQCAHARHTGAPGARRSSVPPPDIDYQTRLLVENCHKLRSLVPSSKSASPDKIRSTLRQTRGHPVSIPNNGTGRSEDRIFLDKILPPFRPSCELQMLPE